MQQLVGKIIQYAIWLGVTGQLVDATVSMAHSAELAQQHQLSLSKLTRALTYCDFGTEEYGSKKCSEYRRRLAARHGATR
jgi:hypothetical protein